MEQFGYVKVMYIVRNTTGVFNESINPSINQFVHFRHQGLDFISHFRTFTLRALRAVFLVYNWKMSRYVRKND